MDRPAAIVISVEVLAIAEYIEDMLVLPTGAASMDEQWISKSF